MTTQTPDAVREALRPFSDLADWIDVNRPRHANPSMEVQVENWPYTLSVEWLYNARKALASLDGRAGDAQPALEVGRKFLAACNSAWSCGEPYHRVKTMMDRADDFQKALDAYDAIPAALDSRAGMKDATSDLRDFADRVMEAAANCCTDPDAGPSSQTSVSFTGEEGARIANDLHRLIDSRAGDAGEGWELVPVEPTEAMQRAFTEKALTGSVHGAGGWHGYAREQWAAMLATAPVHATPAPAVDAVPAGEVER